MHAKVDNGRFLGIGLVLKKGCDKISFKLGL